VVASAVLLLWGAYTLVQTLLVLDRLSEPASTALGLVLGLAAVGLLRRSGWTAESCFLGPGRLSAGGAAALGWLVLLWPTVLASGEWLGWDPGRALVQGLGGVGQELFFRAALLPLLLARLPGRWTALVLHSVLFTVWHAGALLVTPVEAIGGAIALLVVAFLAGLSWGWQTVHDGTVRWAMAHHAALWVVGSMFLLAPPD
jgi:membrane protease YdiL (CAAX protease family)